MSWYSALKFELFGLILLTLENDFIKSENSNLKSGLSEDQINKLILARNNARDDKNFALSDYQFG